MLHGLQTDMGRGVTVLQERGCLLLWPDSVSLSLQLSQHWDRAAKVDGLAEYQEIQKDYPFLKGDYPFLITLPAESCVLNFFIPGEFTCCRSMDCHLSWPSARSCTWVGEISDVYTDWVISAWREEGLGNVGGWKNSV